MKVEVWSDVQCPWCPIGGHRLREAIAAFPQADQVQVVWRSFLLDPGATSDGRPVTERLADKYGVSLEQAQAMNERVSSIAAQDGIEYHLDRAISASTVDAHRLLHLAADRGRQDALRPLLDAAYFADGVDLGDHAELTRLAVEAGLEPGEVADVLAGDAYDDAVRADLAQAQAYGITGVPFVVLDGRLGVSGAQPVPVYAQALAQAWAQHQPLVGVIGTDAGTCTDESCAI